MKTYVINLDRSPGRLASMSEQLCSLGVPFERIPAVDGLTLAHGDLPAKTSLTPGEVGCFLSHRSIWNLVASRREPYGLVLEDDVHLASAFPLFALCTDWIPADADIVKIETTLRPARVSEQAAGTWQGHSIRWLMPGHAGTAGYVISSKAAATLAARLVAPTAAIDNLMFAPEDGRPSDLTIYQIDPALCVQDAFLQRAEQNPDLASTMSHDRPRKTTPQKITREVNRFYRRIAFRLGPASRQQPLVVRRPIDFQR